MRRLLLIPLAAALLGVAAGCSHDNEDDLSKYEDWRVANEEWVREAQLRKNPDGTPYYSVIVPVWNPGIFTLIHYFNDRSETAGNLSPMYTSTVDVRYIGRDIDGVPFDSSTTINKYGTPGVARFMCTNLIQGWTAALEQMHVEDTVEIIVPYQAGYGSQVMGTIKPYSTLRFNMRLVDIYKYEASPY